MAFGDADVTTPAFVKASVAGKNVTTASFTPPNGALLVAFAWHDTAGGNVTNTSVVTDSLGLTWAIQATRSKQSDGVGAANSHVQVSTATATGAAMTVTTTGTNTNNPCGLYVLVVTGADTTTPMDATPVEGTTNAAVVSTSITTVTDGARCYLMVIDWNVAAAMTAGAGQTAVISDFIGATDDRIYLGVTNAVTSPAGSQSLSTGSPSTGNTQNWIGIALRPAAGGGPTELDAGNAAVAAAGNAAVLSSRPAATHGAVALAAQSATLRLSPPATYGAVAVGASNVTVLVGVTLTPGNAAVGAAAGSAALAVSPAAGHTAVGAAAGGVTLIAGLPAGFGAVAVGAFDAVLQAVGPTILSPGFGAVAVGAFDVTLTGGDGGGGQVSVTTGGWQGLADILDEIRQNHAEQLAETPVACWHDGEPLQSVRDVEHCRFCGRTYGPDGQL